MTIPLTPSDDEVPDAETVVAEALAEFERLSGTPASIGDAFPALCEVWRESEDWDILLRAVADAAVRGR